VTNWLTRAILPVALAASIVAPFLAQAPQGARPRTPESAAHAATGFQPGENCLACHNTLTTSSGEDVSIGSAWRASMMANSARDPYWQASVRRETIDHRSATKAIEDECSICHMPMARAQARAAGGQGEVFAHLPIGRHESPPARLAADGVSCTLCHQIAEDGLGTRGSFTGRFVVKGAPAHSEPSMFGSLAVDAGRSSVMRSSSGAKPTESAHMRQSELCATCHTLYTEALGADDKAAGSLPEQVPFLEWQHSAFRNERSCQSCHMPVVSEPTPVSSVFGEPREGFSRHTFIGGNFFMLRMFNRFRNELGVWALPLELEASARATVRQLQSDTATVSILNGTMVGTRLQIDVAVSNLTGHKLPTGYPSRRAWLHLAVRDAAGRIVFESGAVSRAGAIDGNDNDADAARYEPHYDEIRKPDEVQIYESVMTDASGSVTTGLLFGTRFVKDNRLLPRGFDKATAVPDIAVRGTALEDGNFGASGDRVRFLPDVSGAGGPFEIEVELRYQPIGFRWAQNLKRYDAEEPRRFISFYEAMAQDSSLVLARSTARVP
jgi:hypothetical protein